MEFKPDQLPQKQENLYKGNKLYIEASLDPIWESPRNRDLAASGFFGVEKGALTTEEMENFELYSRYADKRILNASLHRDAVPKDMMTEHIINRDINFLALHDIAHSITVFHYGSEHGRNSIIPEHFLLSEAEEINNKRIFEEEAHATIWTPVFATPIPLSLYLANENNTRRFLDDLQAFKFTKKDGAILTGEELFPSIKTAIQEMRPRDLESYIETYLKTAYVFIEHNNSNTIRRVHKNDQQNEIEYLEKEAHKLTEQLAAQPNPKLIESLTNIYNNQSNPKVLYNEFYRICQPIIARLRKSKASSDPHASV